jgi:hypothetical protein
LVLRAAVGPLVVVGVLNGWVMKIRSKPSRNGQRTNRDWAWADLPDEELLEVRLSELGVRIEGTWLEAQVDQLYDELQSRSIVLRPHVWLAEEWFSPDGIPGIAIPFFLAHPRLTRLERKFMLEAEGGNPSWCMKILRHETGHCLDTAYRLHHRRSWQRVFGKASQPYPEYYQPRPYSKSFVLHLDLWYAQSHPCEDFAETFAVWLKPRSRWRSDYEGWPARKKLEYVDDLFQELKGQRPLVTSKQHAYSIKTETKSLRQHYQEKCQRYLVDVPDFYDRDLLRLFSNSPEFSKNPTAASFLRRHRTALRQTIAHWTGQYQYVIDQVINDMVGRCRQLKLRLRRGERQSRRDALVMITVQTMNYLHAGHHRVAL